MKKITSIALSLALGLGLLASAGLTGKALAADKPVKLLAACLANESHPYGMAMKWMDEYLKKNNSTLSLDLQLGGVLGGDRETAEQTVMGSIDIGANADMSLSPMMPKVAFINFPGLFKDYDQVKKDYWADNGWAGQEVRTILNDNGLEVLCFLDNGFRWMTNSKHPITKAADLKGMKMRVPEVKFLVDFFKELGTVTTPVAFGELATALQQGVVDGQDNGLSSIYPYAFYEFNKYMTQTNHSFSSGLLYMNLEKWQTLSPQQQKDLKGAAAYAAEKQRAHNFKFYDDKTKELIEKHGILFADPDASMMPDMIAVGKKLANREDYLKVFGADLVKKMYP